MRGAGWGTGSDIRVSLCRDVSVDGAPSGVGWAVSWVGVARMEVQPGRDSCVE